MILPYHSEKFHMSRDRRITAKEDAKRYRQGYPGLEEPSDAWDNLRFYKGILKSRSSGGKWPESEDYVDNFHDKCERDLNILERGSYEWLFPIREQGANPDSQPLTRAERDAMLEEPDCVQRLRRSYELALRFYGLSMDPKSDKLTRTAEWDRRSKNLGEKRHNYLRITRILKWLGEFGFNAWQGPLVRTLASGIYERPHVLWPMRSSLTDYFVPVVKDDDLRKALEIEIAGFEIAGRGPGRSQPMGRLEDAKSSTRKQRSRSTTRGEKDKRRGRKSSSSSSSSSSKKKHRKRKRSQS
eukprot:TRINITY_DN11289_c0_g1_i1.p1 TRINITY_DN11289_c0_g1~~TRINITY_DN11289_c0_g1_i1.p1  ORF type:complete len:298 (-),score=32.28 TRINITY_DN11289_c0_g1_i1:44-937(-)